MANGPAEQPLAEVERREQRQLARFLVERRGEFLSLGGGQPGVDRIRLEASDSGNRQFAFRHWALSPS